MDTKSNQVNANHLCVSMVPIFNHLPNEDLLEIAKTSQSKTYQKKEIIFQAGEPSDYLYIIHKGKVRLYHLSESGKEQLIRILNPGDFMGELAIFTDAWLTNYAEAVEKTEICAIHKQDLKASLLKKPEISLKILEESSKRLKEAEKTIERLNTQDAEKRLASYLIEHSRESVHGGRELSLAMSKKDLASFIGVSQETLSRRLTVFEENGWITQVGQRKIKIQNYDKLRKISSD